MPRILALALILAASAARADTTIAVTVGDSIVQTYPEPYLVPIQGWGAKMALYTEGVTWVNRAVGGTSTKSFVERGYWANALAEHPGFMLIMFGYGDASPDVESHTEPSTYRANLHQMILDVRAIGGEPILVTPSTIRYPALDGFHVLRPDNLEAHVAAMIAQGAEDAVQVIDLHAMTVDLYDAIGIPQAQELYGFYNAEQGWEDRLHFSVYGAQEAARMIAEQLPDMAPDPPDPPTVGIFPY
jgi:lysophospholipase L1-like esterase